MDEKNIKVFLETLGKLYGYKHNVKVTYHIRKKRKRKKKTTKDE